ncbi:ABC transporter substrate-binding protein [Puniceibacterium confluentis]|uniref:ABC transporter substrate-binding protein n=1 Tax=Puniceibacterium confluentis TaxID=1958944 RepID=UPI001646491E
MIFTQDFDSLMQTPVGSGPFRLAEYLADDVAIAERNPDYFVVGQPCLDRIEVKTFPDAVGAAAALLQD